VSELYQGILNYYVKLFTVILHYWVIIGYSDLSTGLCLDEISIEVKVKAGSFH